MRTVLLAIPAAVAGFMCLSAPVSAQSGDLHVLVSNGMREVVKDVLPQAEHAAGRKLTMEFGSTTVLRQKIDSGEPFDALILTTDAVADYVKSAKIAAGTRTDLARCGIGVGIRQGAPKPDISTPEALKRTLLKSKGISYAQDGASRVFLEKMFTQFGIMDALKPKIMMEQGSVRSAAKVARGEAELIMTLVSEILPEPGVELVGPLPREVQNYVSFAAGASANSKSADAAKALVKFLGGPGLAATLKAKGMEPPVVANAAASAPRGQADLPKAPTDVKPGSITYDDIPYPYPVSYLPLTLYGQDVRMAYMDIPPAGTPNGRIVVLLHGMNFGGFYFGGPIELLRNEGFRVVVPDQIGFGRSSKAIIPYNFHDMAANTRKLLQTLGINRAAIVGHSMGGMLAARFAASYPDVTERAVLYNPIGLTDVRWQGPWRTADEAYQATMASSQDELYQGFYATIRRYFPTPGAWKPEYDKYVRILYAPTLSGDWPRLAMVRAIYRQITILDPVVYDWAHIKARTLVLGGDKDGENFPALAKHIADTIPHGELVLLPNLGHVPHIESPELFNRELLKFLKSN